MTIEAASPGELPLCHALLPPLAMPDLVAFVARGSDGALVGAGGIGWQSWGHPPGFPAWVQVLPDCRGRGVGRALADSIIAAGAGEAPALWAATPLAEADGAAAFATRLGFVPVSRQFHFRADATRFLAMIDSVVARLRPRVPAAARLLPVEPAHVKPVAALIAEQVRHGPRDIAARLRASFHADPRYAPVDLTRSRVLLVDDRVAGALLTRRLPDGVNAQIVVNALAPDVRRGWANALLLAETTRAGVADGCAWFDFDCDEAVRDTLNLARRGAADLLRVEGLYRYALTTAG